MIYTTLSRIRANYPGPADWSKLLTHLGKTRGDDEPLAYSTIIDSNGLNDALWCLRAEPQHAALWRMYAVRCARRVQHLITDPRSVAALDVAERHAYGQATDEELAAAWEAAWKASAAASAAARYAACEDACEAALEAAWKAACNASATAWASAKAEQTLDFLRLLAAYEAAPGCVAEAIL